MQLTSLLVLAGATAGMAMPAINARAAAAPAWTITGFTRTCDKADTVCTVKFGVDTHLAAPVSCSYTVKGAPASQASTDNISCGPYTISSGWSGIFGPGQGFTTWAFVDRAKGLITWPSYADAELVNGVAVSPDKSYPPQSL
ncbi:hypothetical protein QBC47DRAFT_362496 [Echria macrotheca]|uniref:Uncharacterized protein n=1 Tax=Echria macrotheca TaxID=438768 RepID=A0AAJ0F9X9_9PEZI|nr:hypothetical protein QBC47DRAFT_362496 [Echria macrotheca]